MDGEPISEPNPRPVSDWIVIRSEWSDLTVSPLYKTFLEVGEQLSAAGLARLQPVWLFSSSPGLLEKEMEATFLKITEDNPLNDLRKAKLLGYTNEEKGYISPYIVRTLKYNQYPDVFEHDELYVMASKAFLEVGHRRIEKSGAQWTDVQRLDLNDVAERSNGLKNEIKAMLAESPVYTPTGEEFVPSMLREL